MGNFDIHTDQDLLLNIAAGDEQAFASFFHAYKSFTYSIAYSFTKNQVISEEIVQDIFLHLWLKRESVSEIMDLKGWLFVVVRNKSLRILQKMAIAQKKETLYRSQDAGTENSIGNMVDVFEEREFQNIISEAMSLLTQQQQKVFELIKIHGYSRHEAAIALGLSPNTIKNHLAFSLPIVREFLIKKLGKTIAPLLLSVFFDRI